MTAPRALITGVTGQDGSYLAELLLEKGYEVHGVVRRSSTETFERIAHLTDRIHLHQADLLDQMSLLRTLQEAQPTEVYNLAVENHHNFAVDGIGILVHNKASAEPSPVAFRADHPFIFMIRDIPTGTILFMGRVEDPGQQGE